YRPYKMTVQDYNQLITNYADNVYRFILKNLRHEADAQDIVQSAFEKVWINKDNVEASTSKSYLFTVAYNLMIDHIRKAKRTVLRGEFPEELRRTRSSVGQVKEVLRQALQRLSETQRSLVMLKDYEGYSYEEIGKITNLSGSQVKVYLHRAR